MRIFATFLCVFLLVLLFGSSSYVYILWRKALFRVQKYRDEEDAAKEGNKVQQNFLSDDPELRGGGVIGDSSDDLDTISASVTQSNILGQVSMYETQILAQFRNAVVDTGRSIKLGEIKNAYRVMYNGTLGNQLKLEAEPKKLVCEAFDTVRVSTFVRGDEFFKKQQLDQYFLPEQLLQGRVFKSCGVVSSSGSMQGSGLGKQIDSEDFVIRFNDAPTSGHEQDVGRKTSLRIVNSQVVGKPEYKFLESRSRLYSRSPVLVWDPSAYNGSLKDWYENPDYPFFETFFSKRLMRPGEKLYLLRPQSMWSIWNWLQKYTKYPILPNPPSSGFLGIVLSLFHCHRVNVYEYVPSMRLTKRCHYYDDSENLGCTIGDWHPLAAEKLMALSLNEANKTQVYSAGFLSIVGAPELNCRERGKTRKGN